MSSEEDRADAASIPAKKRRIQRACDMCRLKRKGCDGLRMVEKKCTNCAENGLECTFAGLVAKRRSYIDVLEARLELTEQLLRNLVPPQGEASSSGAQNIEDIPRTTQWSSDSPILKRLNDSKTTDVGTPGPGVELAALTIRSMNTPAPLPPGESLEYIALTQDFRDLSIDQLRERFNGASSDAMFVKATVLVREDREQQDVPWASRRMRYWTFNPAESRITTSSTYVFPPADLFAALVSLYFAHNNIYYPLLHRPTFDRAVADGLHLHDDAFAAVVLVVCAIGARFSTDPRVTPEGADVLTCGWQYFGQLQLTLNHLFLKPRIHHVQYYCLATMFLEMSMHTTAWSLIGIGIRLAQDVGAHRARPSGTRPTVESELWKRAVWVLVCKDREMSGMLGRPCTAQFEELDVELPIECSDEFWEGEPAAFAAGPFVQPPGRPPTIAYFNCLVRLNHILAFSLKMLYSLNKTKSLLAVRDEAWEEHIVAELDSALNSWVDSIPAHLRWDPKREDEEFFDQSAYLYAHYYLVQMTIHRPFIPMIRRGASTSLPSLAICTNAARSCSHIVDTCNQRKRDVPIPGLLWPAFTSGLVLLLNVWSGKRTGLPPQLNTAMAEVHKCMACIRNCEDRWQSAGIQWDLLYEIASIGQMPLPNQRTKSPHAPAPAFATVTGNKRLREEDGTGYSSSAVAHHPSYANDTTEFHTADLSVFNELPQEHLSPASGDKNTPGPGLEIGSLDFGGGNADAGQQSLGMDSDALAVWANAPMGFEMDDWSTYFNAMSELDQGPAGADNE
ncbi:fungal-specific transcription factor domain-containing protein [Mycena crocata]|nr:fungal-specific transcription factor domain-containing protein [Mycena crocata]